MTVRKDMIKCSCGEAAEKRLALAMHLWCVEKGLDPDVVRAAFMRAINLPPTMHDTETR